MTEQDFKYIAYSPDANGNIPYNREEDETWSILYRRQLEVIKSRACRECLHGIELLGLSTSKVPQPNDVSRELSNITGWSVEPVAALINFRDFFTLLSNRKFPAASFIRRRQDLDYLKEPDIFHEIFGHCPMLTNPDFAAFTYEIGRFGMTLEKPDLPMLARLYWFTVEFGLIAQDGLKIYGAGILSSKSESIYALENATPRRSEFNLIEVLRTTYRYDEIQKNYFIINSFDELFNMIDGGKLLDSFHEARSLGLLGGEVNTVPSDIRSC